MADSPIGYTTHYTIAKWNDGDQPGAIALNNNYDIIDTSIYNAITASSISGTEPIYMDGNYVNLRYVDDNLKIDAEGLNTIQDIHSTSTPTWAGATLNGNFSVTTGVVTINAPTTVSNSIRIVGPSVFSGSMQITGSLTLEAEDVTSSLNSYVDIRDLSVSGQVDILGNHPSSWNINRDLDDVDVTLQFMRSTGGNAAIFWNGNVIQTTKVFDPWGLTVGQISQTEPVGSHVVPGFMYLDPTV